MLFECCMRGTYTQACMQTGRHSAITLTTDTRQPRPTQPSTHSASSAASLLRACLMAARSVLFKL